MKKCNYKLICFIVKIFCIGILSNKYYEHVTCWRKTIYISNLASSFVYYLCFFKVLRYFTQLINGVEYLHSQFIIHKGII